MSYTSIYNGILFIEGSEKSATILGKVEYKRKKLFNTQLNSLDTVKEQLAQTAISMGGNAVIDFNYGQKENCWLWDCVQWYGNGLAANIPENRWKEIVENIR